MTAVRVLCLAFTIAGACLTAPALRLAAAPQVQRFDLVIRGGELHDGTGAPGRRTDVGIVGDTIAAVGDLSRATASRRIEAKNLVVAPGFIDMHSHSDFPLLVDGRGLSKVHQGVTTELFGESGSAAPALGPARDELARSLAEFELTLDWATLGEYFARLERQGTSVNIVSTVGTGQVRAAVVGYDRRAATADEIAKMEALVEQAMRDGAVGVSSGLIYPPNQYASTEELIALAKVAARHGGIYVSHIRNEAGGLLTALEEAIRIGREAGTPVEVLHFKRSSIQLDAAVQKPSIQEAAALLEAAQRDGVKIYADVYPYPASQTTLSVRIPDWAREGGRQKMLERLRDPATREKIRNEVRATFGRGTGGATGDTILFGLTTYEPHRRFQGRRVTEIASELGVEPAEAILELVDKADGLTSAVYFSMREEDVRYALTLPWTTIGSDGSALAPEGILARGHPHPRSYGTFPRVLARYVREQQALTLAEAIRKMTSLPASRLGLADRGSIAVGRRADLVVFDAATIIDRANYARPHRLAEGVRHLVVNGEAVIRNGAHTGARPGRVLRHRSGS
ncbi:MAG TPA: D-aminoacylase [Vicinamibacterales bacterium]|nr:D-aminoacylase [Vicinamibacterales bacterium]